MKPLSTRMVTQWRGELDGSGTVPANQAGIQTRVWFAKQRGITGYERTAAATVNIRPIPI